LVSWLRQRNRKRAAAHLGFAGGAVLPVTRLAGLRQEPEPEPHAEPFQSASKIKLEKFNLPQNENNLQFEMEDIHAS
jgi:hypothetical protein